MRLFEITDTDPFVTKLVAVSDQLKTDLEDGETNSEMTVDQLLKYLQKYDIVLDKIDLYNMIKKPPLKNLIDNIQGKKVIFKGFGSTENPEDDSEEKNVVKSMAAKAAKNIASAK